MMRERSVGKSPSPAQVAEAAAWVAHLHCADRTSDSDRGLKLWLKDDPARQRAWEMATEAWDDLRLLQTSAVLHELEEVRGGAGANRRRIGLVAAFAATVLVAVMSFFVGRDPPVETGVGEQRTLSLEDGTQVTLNTATRVVVLFDERQRLVELKAGEALFDVTSHAAWPFVVRAGAHEIKALGTAFVVRRDGSGTSVTLMDGKVAVSDVLENKKAQLANQDVILVPGQRLTFSDKAAPRLDQPSIEKVTAWRRGKVIFERIRLADAIAEMNRYSTQRLTVRDPRAAEVHISGVFKYGDSLRFAQAVAATYELEVIESNGDVSIVGAPEQAYR